MAESTKSPKLAAIVSQFQREHPEAKRVRVIAITRKKVFLRYDCPRLGPAGLCVRLNMTPEETLSALDDRIEALLLARKQAATGPMYEFIHLDNQLADLRVQRAQLYEQICGKAA